MSHRTFQGTRAHELFPVLAYDADSALFVLDDQSLAFGFLCEPLPGVEESQRERLVVLANLDWPAGSLVQAMLWTSPDIDQRLAVMRGMRIQTVDPLLRETTERTAEFLSRGSYKPLSEAIDVRLREISVLVTAKIPCAGNTPSEHELREAREMLATSKQVLATAGLFPQTLTSDAYVRVMQTILNWGETPGWRDRIIPECDRERLIREQLFDYDAEITVDAKGLKLGSQRVQTFSVKRFPEISFFGQAFRYLGDPRSGQRGIRHNVLITLTMHMPDPEKKRVALNSGAQWAAHQTTGNLQHFAPRVAQVKQDYDNVFRQIENGDRPLEAYLGVVLFTEESDASAAASNLRTYWRELGFQIMADRFFALPLFLQCLPFGGDRAAIDKSFRFRTLSATHAVVLMPVFGDWKGTGTPVVNLVGRAGQLMNLSLYDSASNYNAVIAAQSGSGKSFFANELLSTNLAVGGRCWVIDVGRSYENLCESLGGQFIAFGRDSDIVLNPFELIEDWSEEADVITALVTAMAAPTEPLGDLRTAALKQILKSLWDAHGTAMSVDLIAESLSNDDDERVKDVGRQLFPFTTRGEYGRFFSGHNTIRFDSDFVVLELEELKGRKHLQTVILLQLIYQVQQAMYLGVRDRQKMMLIDEAWDLLTHGDVAKFIEHGYRRFRKYGGSAIVCTQSIADLYTSKTGEAIAQNSAFNFLLAQPSNAIDQLVKANRLPLSEGGADLLKTVHTVKGAYSEIMVISDFGAGIGRLVVDPFRKLLYSTDHRDVTRIRELRERGLSVEDAINTLLGREVRHAA